MAHDVEDVLYGKGQAGKSPARRSLEVGRGVSAERIQRIGETHIYRLTKVAGDVVDCGASANV